MYAQIFASIRRSVALLLLGVAANSVAAQTDSSAWVYALPPATVCWSAEQLAHVDSLSRRYSSLEKKVLKVWPYASLAGVLMDSLRIELDGITEKRERKALIEKREAELMAQFEKDLMKLRISEGVILIRLIDRQAGETSYGVVRELKGRFSAFMWQGLARIFGHNLKAEYDQTGRDAAIEHIIARHRLH
mgnify:FL=1